jgi:acyl dehydratase
MSVELPAMPSTGALYRRAVAGVARRPPSDLSLPSAGFVVRGIGVEIERLAAYDRVCGFRLTDALPATYPHVLAFPLAMHMMSEPSFPLRVIGLVHIANRITLSRPIRVHERLDISVHAEDLREHDRGQQVDVVATASVDGVDVWRGVSTYLRRSAPRGRSMAQPVDRHAADPEAGSTSPVTNRSPSAMWSVGRDIGQAYAEVSGDRNPIHTSRLGARAFGFRRPIAHGMWSAARCLAAMEGRLPDAFTVDIAFKRPILLPSTVAFSGTTSAFSLADSSGVPHLRGAVTV